MNEYWNSEEGRKVANGMGKAGVDVLGAITGLKDPTGSVSEAASKAAEVMMPYVADTSQKLMANVYETYKTEADQVKSEHFIKDANGTSITAQTFAENGRGDIADQLKERYMQDVTDLQSKAAQQYSLQEKAYQNGEMAAAKEHQQEGDRLVQEAKQREKDYQSELQELYSQESSEKRTKK